MGLVRNSGTNVAKMMYCDVAYFGGSAGGGTTASITVTYTDDFIGATITCTDGITTLTETATSAGSVTFEVEDEGEWSVYSIVDGNTWTVPPVMIIFDYDTEQLVMIPDGSTVTPTDDIHTWLLCAGIRDKDYTTLAEVLEDSVTFNALLGDSNACDYMARSTTLAGVTGGLVPTMTSNTTPSGRCFVTPPASESTSNYPIWHLFDNNVSTKNEIANTVPGSTVLAYEFANATVCNRAVVGGYAWENMQYKVQTFQIVGSNDGETWTPLSEVETNTAASSGDTQEVIFDNTTAYTTYGLLIVTGTNNYTQIESLQFYYDGITTSALAMSILGRYDYACEAVLANEDWVEAIANSDYYESVLDVKVPVMTSNTTPSGTASASSEASSGQKAFHAFDGSTSSAWYTPSGGSSSASVSGWLQYDFGTPVKIYAWHLNFTNNGNYGGTIEYPLKGSNDGSTWVDIDSMLVAQGSNKTQGVSVDTAYRYYRIVVPQANYRYRPNTNNFYCCVTEAQFYGRHSSDNLVPLVPTMTSNTTPSGEAFADSYYPGTNQEPFRAFDGDNSTYWNNSQTSANGYIGYDFGRNVLIKRFYFRVAYAMTNAVLEGYDGSDWNTIHSIGSMAGGTEVTVDLSSNTTAYSKYRVSATANNQYNALSVITLQFYGLAPTSVLHSVPNDTVYYLDNGIETTLCTCDANGVGEVDWTGLQPGVYTLYSTVAKDPNGLSYDYSIDVRVTPNKLDGYVMPDGTLYWYGYIFNDIIESCTSANGWNTNFGAGAATFNTNDITLEANRGIGTKRVITGSVKAIVQGLLLSGNDYGYTQITSAKSSYGSYNSIRSSAITKFDLGNASSQYAAIYTSNSRKSTVYALFLEESTS